MLKRSDAEGLALEFVARAKDADFPKLWACFEGYAVVAQTFVSHRQAQVELSIGAILALLSKHTILEWEAENDPARRGWMVYGRVSLVRGVEASAERAMVKGA